jgi:hypothetical protein
MSASAASFSLVAGSAPVAAARLQVFGSTSAGEESLDWQRLEGKRLGERLGAPMVLIYGSGKETVARDCGAYPEKFGRWRDFLNRIVVGSFGIQAELYSVDWFG